MKFITKLCALLIAAFAPIEHAIANDMIESRSEFLQKVAGKRISEGNNTWLIAQTNGKLKGQYRGVGLSGDWQWQGKFWCRTGRVGIIPLPFECQQVTLNNDTLVLTRKKGTGASFTYKVQ